MTAPRRREDWKHPQPDRVCGSPAWAAETLGEKKSGGGPSCFLDIHTVTTVFRWWFEVVALQFSQAHLEH